MKTEPKVLWAVIGQQVKDDEWGIVAVAHSRLTTITPLVCVEKHNKALMWEVALTAPLHKNVKLVRFEAVETEKPREEI